MGRFAALLIAFVAAIVGVAGVLGLGFVLDGPRAPLQRSDAIIVISGDEALARFFEGLRLYHQGWGRVLIFSGAAHDQAVSNAEVMRDLALARGVPPDNILVEPDGTNTLGNARHTRQLMEQHGLRSGILVTSPYHLRRAQLTFDAVFAGSGVRLIAHAAPDSEWRKLTWWLWPDTRRLTLLELEKLAYILVTGRYH